MPEQLAVRTRVSVEYDVDVCVIGGGPAGVAAAVTAARCGARVFLAERTGCFGGMGTAGLVPTFCGAGNGERILGGKFCQEVFRSLYGALDQRRYDYPIDSEVLKRTYDDLVLGEPGISFVLDCVFLDVICLERRIQVGVFSSCSSMFAVKAKVFVDATGDGDVAYRGHVPYAIGNEAGQIMPATLCSMWSNVDWKRYHEAGMSIPKIAELLKQAAKDQVFRVYDRHHTGMTPVGLSHGTANMGHIFGLNATDYRQKTKAYVEGRRQMKEFEKFYRTYVPGFEQAQLSATAALMGIRESRRVECDYRLTIDDFVRKACFDDEIGRFAYSVDIHPFDASLAQYERFQRDFSSSYRYRRGESYGVPYRMLIAKTLDNLLIAGRCVCTDQQMEASIRVMPGCFLTGQAAGAAAYLSLVQDGRVRYVNLADLQALVRD